MKFLESLETTNPNIAYVYAITGYACLAVTQIIFKYITLTISPFQALFMRSFSLFCLNSFLLSKTGETPYIKQPRVFGTVLLRLLFSTTYTMIVHYCIKYLPVSTVSTLSNTAPIFIFFIEAIHYKKSLNKINLCLTCLSFVGVICILQPDFIFHNKPVDQISNFQFLSFLVILGAFCFAMTMLFIHDLAKKISSIVNLHYSYLSHIVATALLANFYTPAIAFEQINGTFIFAFTGLVLFALFTQYMIFTATSLKRPSHTMPFGYVTIVTTISADLFIFNIKFDLLQVIGIVLTSVGLLSKFLVSEQQKSKSEYHPEQFKDNPEDIINMEEEIRKSQMQETEKI